MESLQSWFETRCLIPHEASAQLCQTLMQREWVTNQDMFESFVERDPDILNRVGVPPAMQKHILSEVKANAYCPLTDLWEEDVENLLLNLFPEVPDYGARFRELKINGTVLVTVDRFQTLQSWGIESAVHAASLYSCIVNWKIEGIPRSKLQRSTVPQQQQQQQSHIVLTRRKHDTISTKGQVVARNSVARSSHELGNSSDGDNSSKGSSSRGSRKGASVSPSPAADDIDAADEINDNNMNSTSSTAAVGQKRKVFFSAQSAPKSKQQKSIAATTKYEELLNIPQEKRKIASGNSSSRRSSIGTGTESSSRSVATVVPVVTVRPFSSAAAAAAAASCAVSVLRTKSRGNSVLEEKPSKLLDSKASSSSAGADFRTLHGQPWPPTAGYSNWNIVALKQQITAIDSDSDSKPDVASKKNVQNLLSSDPLVQCKALKLISSKVATKSHSDRAATAALAAGALFVIVQMLRSVEELPMCVIREATVTFNLLVARGGNNIAQFIAANADDCLPVLVQQLIASTQKHTKVNAVMLIGNLSMCSEELQLKEKLLQANAIPHLAVSFAAVSNGVFTKAEQGELLLAYAETIQQLCYKSTADTLEKMLQLLAVVKTILQEATANATLQHCCNAIVYLLDRKGKAVKKVIDRLEQLEIISLLTMNMKSESLTVRKAVLDTLRFLAGCCPSKRAMVLEPAFEELVMIISQRHERLHCVNTPKMRLSAMICLADTFQAGAQPVSAMLSKDTKLLQHLICILVQESQRTDIADDDGEEDDDNATAAVANSNSGAQAATTNVIKKRRRSQDCFNCSCNEFFCETASSFLKLVQHSSEEQLSAMNIIAVYPTTLAILSIFEGHKELMLQSLATVCQLLEKLGGDTLQEVQNSHGWASYSDHLWSQVKNLSCEKYTAGVIADIQQQKQGTDDSSDKDSSSENEDDDADSTEGASSSDAESDDDQFVHIEAKKALLLARSLHLIDWDEDANCSNNSSSSGGGGSGSSPDGAVGDDFALDEDRDQ